jgi:carbon storage regulator
MLVLTRKVGGQVLIGDGITVEVLGVVGRRVRLGIQAPPDLAIRRKERREFPEPGAEAAPRKSR